MSERRHCTNCGAEVGPHDAFCAGCGASLTSAAARSGGPEPTTLPRGNTGPSGAGALLAIVGRARRLFANIPVGAGVLAALAAVLLELVFSRIVAVAATVLLGASALVLLVRAVRRASFGRWGTVAAASLVVAVASAGVYDVLHGGANGAGSDPGVRGGVVSGNGTPDDAGSFVAPADARLCLGGGDGPEDYSGPALDFRVVDSREAETRSGIRGLALMVGTSLYEGLDAIAQNLAVNPDRYDAVEVIIFAREWAFYTPTEGVQPLPGAPSSYGTTYYVAHSEAGEEVIGLKDQNLNECGTSYEDGGYKWGTRSLY